MRTSAQLSKSDTYQHTDRILPFYGRFRVRVCRSVRVHRAATSVYCCHHCRTSNTQHLAAVVPIIHTHTHCLLPSFPDFLAWFRSGDHFRGVSPDICRNGFEDGVLSSFKIVSVRAYVSDGSECFSDPANGNHFFLLLFRSNPSSRILKDRLCTNGITRDRWAAASLSGLLTNRVLEGKRR